MDEERLCIHHISQNRITGFLEYHGSFYRSTYEGHTGLMCSLYSMDINASDILELYRKRNRVEHCFRTINTMGIAFPVHHWTEQKIKVHMFFSLKAYLFLALIYNEVHTGDEEISLISTIEYLKDININYAMIGKKIVTKLEFKSDVAEIMGKTMKLESMVKE